jgi:hypothetical protein
MPTLTPRIRPFLWFDTQAEEAMTLYVSVFKNSKVLSANRAGGRRSFLGEADRGRRRAEPVRVAQGQDRHRRLAECARLGALVGRVPGPA